MLFLFSFFRASLMILLAILVVLNVQFFWKNKCISQIEISEKIITLIQKKRSLITCAASSHARNACDEASIYYYDITF